MPAYGFVNSHEAILGSWTRGDDGSLYAKWCAFNDVSLSIETDKAAVLDVDNIEIPVPAFAWLLNSSVLGLIGWRRSQNAPAILG